MGLDSLSSRRDRGKLKWWHKLCTMEGDRYPRQLFDQVWEVKPRRGTQRKMWGKRVDDIFEMLWLDKEEWFEDIQKENSSSKSFLACVDECVDECVYEMESNAFWKGLDINICTIGLLDRVNSRSTYMAQGLHCCLTLDQERMV